MKRKYSKTPTDKMVNIDTSYMRAVMRESGVNQSELSEDMGYCKEYLSNSITDGRMNKEILMMLSDMLYFSYKSALDSKRKNKKNKKK